MVRPRKYSIDDLHKHAKRHSGRCLDSEYQGFREPSTWQCENGHTWRASWESVKRSPTFCTECIGRRHPGTAPNPLNDLRLKEYGGAEIDTKLHSVILTLKQIRDTKDIVASAKSRSFDHHIFDRSLRVFGSCLRYKSKESGKWVDCFGNGYKARSITGEAHPYTLISRISDSAWERFLSVWRAPDWATLSNHELESLAEEYRYMVGQKGHILANRPRQFTFMRQVFNVFLVKNVDYWIGLGGSKISGGLAAEFKALTDELHDAGFLQEVNMPDGRVDTYHSYKNDRIVGAWVDRAGFVCRRSGTGLVVRNAIELCLAVLATGILIEIQLSERGWIAQPKSK